MTTCTANKADGTQCSLAAQPDSDFCWAHAPENAGKRKQIARRGGRSRGARLPARVMADLESLADELENISRAVLDREVDPDVARAATNALTAKQGALKLLREWYLVDVIGAQLDDLEGAQ